MKFIAHLYILSTIVLTVYSQLIIRWKVPLAGSLPDSFSGKASFIFQLFLNPWIISSIVATLFAGISWMLAMSKFEISYAYPWTALNFVFMLMFGVLLFNESFNLQKMIGTLVVMIGIIMIAKA